MQDRDAGFFTVQEHRVYPPETGRPRPDISGVGRAGDGRALRLDRCAAPGRSGDRPADPDGPGDRLDGRAVGCRQGRLRCLSGRAIDRPDARYRLCPHTDCGRISSGRNRGRCSPQLGCRPSADRQSVAVVGAQDRHHPDPDPHPQRGRPGRRDHPAEQGARAAVTHPVRGPDQPCGCRRGADGRAAGRHADGPTDQ